MRRNLQEVRREIVAKLETALEGQTGPCMPESPEEWQTAVNAAKGALAFDSARQYGLVKGGPCVNVDRCVLILEKGRKRGFFPSPTAVEDFARALVEDSRQEGKS